MARAAGLFGSVGDPAGVEAGWVTAPQVCLGYRVCGDVLMAVAGECLRLVRLVGDPAAVEAGGDTARQVHLGHWVRSHI